MEFGGLGFLIGKVWVPVMQFCACVFHTLQSALEDRHEARIVQIDFSVAFDRVSHPGILYKLCSYMRFCLVYSCQIPD